MEFYATLGDPCAKRDILDQLFQTGMTGARLNMSHTSLSQCAPLLEELYWPAARKAGCQGAHLILDLQGPELRVGELSRPIPLREGADILLGDGGIPIPQVILQTAKRGQQISIDDGALLLEVRRTSPTVLLCRVLQGGTLLSKKSLSLLGSDVDTPTLTPADLENLAQAARFGVTHILQPFVRNRRDVEILRENLARLGLSQVQVMAKIENQQGYHHLDEIMEERLWSVMGIDAAFESGSVRETDRLATLYEGGAVYTSHKALLRNVRPAALGATGDNYSGGMTISAPELARMAALLVNDGCYEGLRLLSEESVALLESDSGVQISDGSHQALPLRWRDGLYGRDRLYYHTGSGYGVYNLLTYDPESRDAVVVLTTGASGAKDSQGIYAVCAEITEYLYDVMQSYKAS